MNTGMTENQNPGQSWGPGKSWGAVPSAPQAPYPGQPFPGPVPGQQAPGQPVAGQPYPGAPQPYPGPAAAPSALGQLPLPIKLALGSGIAGLVAFFMGFVAWVTVDESIADKAESWGNANADGFGIPAFLTMVLTPGYFLLGLGTAGVAVFAFVAAKWRRYLPHVAALVVLCWLGLLASALTLPSFISLGAGAIIALIFGAVQFVLIAAAVVRDGLDDH